LANPLLLFHDTGMEVGQRYGAFFIANNVRHLKRAVKDAGGMKRMEGSQQGDTDVNRLGEHMMIL
jgi:hypothetical protein